jgi:gliding motility-associated-like protein
VEVIILQWFKNLKLFSLHIFSILFCSFIFGQTLIINEFSNGPSGAKEYVEFVVVDSAVVYDCTGSAPPCIDIRGWIFDDNSGYHGTNGQAAGAVRFSNNPIWACLPVGTIILVYNGNDPNPSIPPDDVSMSDGNCVLVIALDDLTYFEFTETTPGAAVCSYPAAGWGADPVPDWSNVGMSNSGDCARIVDLAGCEVFSVCYGSCNQNTMIYFAGSGADDVWSFGGGDPQVQANWTQGCAGDISACGSDDQTPGAPNNTANSNYISQFNNNCAPIPLLTSTVSNTSVCGCTNSATVTANGSIPGYTYEWYDATFNLINQTSASATGLCGGTYNVITTSSIGCEDTVQLVIASSAGGFAGIDNTFSICESILPVNLFDSLGVSPDAGGIWIGPSVLTNGDQGTFTTSNSNGIYGYVITGAGGCPNDTAFVDITVGALADAGGDGTISICESGAAVDLFNSIIATPDIGGVWSPILVSGSGVFDPITDAFGGYNYTVSGTNGCPDSISTVTVLQIINPTTAEVVQDISCFGSNDGSIDLTITSVSPYNVNWLLSNSNTPNTDDVNNLSDGMQYFTITNTDGCVVLDSIEINEPLQLSVNYTINAESCQGACDGTITPSATNGVGVVMYSLDGVNFVAGPFVNVCAGNYVITAEDDNGCQDISNVTVLSNPGNTPVINSATDMCVSSAAVQLTASISGGTWSGPGITDATLGIFDPNIAGVSTSQVIYTLTNSCGAADTNYINITDAPSGSFAISDTSGCAPLSVDFESTIVASSAFTCLWDFDNGTVSAACNGVSNVYSAGCYSPTLTVTDANGCSALILFSTPICAIELPDASFSTSSLVMDEFNSQFNAENTNGNIDSYQWFLDGELVGLASEYAMDFASQEERNYDLCLAVENAAGCTDTSCVELTYQGSFSLYVPNAFTPNGDGNNDLFSPVISGQTPLEYEMFIFNRWGELIYNTEDIVASWDGVVKSSKAQMEVYNWKIVYKLPNSSLTETIRGHVTLIR